MKPFLYKVAELFYRIHGAEINRLAFVFPNRRAGLFFQKYISEIAARPIFSPKILTINDLFMQLSGIQPADRIRTLFKLYDIYIRISGSTESFDEFLYWGEMLLNDFDDVDKYMVDAKMLFANIYDLKQLDDDYSFLSPEQIQAIRTFWSSFYPKNNTPNQQNFLELWEILFQIYSELKELLAKENSGYEGMIFREVAERLEQGGELKGFSYKKIVFVGLNALSVSEEHLLLALQKEGIADFYWDYDSPYVMDKDNKASFFAERNLFLFPSEHMLQKENSIVPKIKVVGLPSAIGQAKQVYHILEKYLNDGCMSAESALKTAIVLPDEHLLVPVLNSIPKEVDTINVTMGYPLAATPIASLMEHLLQLQRNVRYINRQPMFYHKDVFPILNHQYLIATCRESVNSLIENITKDNRIYIAASELGRNEFLSLLFKPVLSGKEISEYLINVLSLLGAMLRSGDETDADDSEKSCPPKQTMTDIEQEFVFHYFATVNRLKDIMDEANIEISLDTYYRLLKKMTDLITIPFEGEPLSGLQLMGVLETRALDFDRLIILSMNEGVFPLKKTANSFIPYNLRRGFGLPTYEHQDSIWAYHFYRLIHRAEEVTLLYDTRTSGLRMGEVSRFIHQLRYHYQIPLQNQLMIYNVSSSKLSPINIEKGEKIQKILDEYKEGGSRALSASAINTYLDCPLKFYFSSIECIREEEEVEETVESDVFGSILHKAMEIIYLPLRGKLVTADLLTLLQKDKEKIMRIVEKAFADIFFKSADVRPLVGENYLIGELILKYIYKILDYDRRMTPFVYIDSEERIKATFPISDGRNIRLKGFIDRIDSVGNVIRIVDYKTGSGTTEFKSMSDLFDRTLKERPKAVMQVFLYAWAYIRQTGDSDRMIQPNIYYLRKLFNEQFNPLVMYFTGREKKESVDIFQTYKDEFETEMRKCLDDLFNFDIPFVQTETGKACGFCQFASICGK